MSSSSRPSVNSDLSVSDSSDVTSPTEQERTKAEVRAYILKNTNSIVYSCIQTIVTVTVESYNDDTFSSRIKSITSIPHCTDGDTTVIFAGSNALDFLGMVFGNNSDLLSSVIAKMALFVNDVPTCKVALFDARAVLPFKTRVSDVGYDLGIIHVHKKINNVVTLYKTGVKIQLESGWYVEIVPRSSLIKTGYMLANSIGIIDNTYTGELLVALAKIDPDAKPIEFPFTGVQLIFRKQNFVKIDKVDEQDIGCTERANGGFGSTS